MLHELCFEVKSGERVGIGESLSVALVTFIHVVLKQSVAPGVARCGSPLALLHIGSPRLQTSLTLALLRCIPTDGTVHYSGLDTDALNLDALRTNITIIPQVVSTPHPPSPYLGSHLRVH